MDNLKLLFVCTGNICRSPTAEAVMRKLAIDAGHNVTVDSVGVHGYHVGESPDTSSIAAAKNRGYEMSHLTARQIHPSDYEKFDYLFAMDKGHETTIKQQAPQTYQHKTHLFLPFAGITHSNEVPDPYYGDTAGFNHVLDLLEEACRRTLLRIA